MAREYPDAGSASEMKPLKKGLDRMDYQQFAGDAITKRQVKHTVAANHIGVHL